jgi:exodeoxyribonuclease VII small subunit
MTENYTAMLEELKGIVEKLSREDCPVEELEGLVERASALIKTMKEKLRKTEESVSGMLSELEE